MLLHLWIHTLSASNHETLHDFFHILPEEYKKDLDATPSSESALVVEHSLPVLWLADKIRRLGKLSFQVAQNDPDSIKKELAQRIYEEVYMVQAYCKTWRSTAGMMKDRGKSIEDELHTRVSDTVYPWPEIKATPTGYREDGRFAKSFPLEFPFGVGDLYQPRIRNDFSTVDWAQRQFQYYDGRCISSLRGNRLTWAIFNEALRETSHSTGCLVHRNVHESILTKAELQTMLNSRSDLVQKISSFGADIPTTPMMWKKEGNHLEWIVRQMSWVPPWINDEREEPPIFKKTQIASNKVSAQDEDIQHSDSKPRETRDNDQSNSNARTFQDFSEKEHETLDPEDYHEQDEAGDLETQPVVPTDVPVLAHPNSIWRQVPPLTPRRDEFGYGRNPAFWFTLNYPYNYVFELHRLQEATRVLQVNTKPDIWTHNCCKADRDGMDARFHWTADNADLVVLMHAIRVELNVRYVMSHIVPCQQERDFQYWLRFEFGSNGNPHAHGLNYVRGNPSFESVVADEEMRQKLVESGHHEAGDLKTWNEAERALADFYKSYVSETHPCKDELGNPLYHFVIEDLRPKKHLHKPQTINLYEVLETIFEDPTKEPDLQPLREILVALLEDGGLHCYHGKDKPIFGKHPCARKTPKRKGCAEEVYCRYLFPREIFLATDARPGCVKADPHRENLRNLYLNRNDVFINNFETHLLVSNLGNIDWRPLINLWHVLEYLTKYTSMAGKSSIHMGKLFE